MNPKGLLENLIEQIKEAQLKLGYARETIRLYFPISSLCALLDTECISGKELLDVLKEEKAFSDTVLGPLTFSLCKGERIEVCISPDGAAYVHEQVPDPVFLARIIRLFQENHSLTIEEIRAGFAEFNENYICEKMEPGTDFDYVLYFPDHQPDAWYYCVRIEMGHTIYHRFMEADFRVLLIQK